MKNALLTAENSGETQRSVDRRLKTVITVEDEVRGLQNLKYSMTLQKSIARAKSHVE